MAKSKKIFLIIAAGFILIMIGFTIDFSSRTTFPGKKKKQNIEVIKEDSLMDTLENNK